MDKFELKKIKGNRYYLNIFQGDEENLFSQGFTFEAYELQDLYIKLREVFTKK
jgi:hypothetical protein